MPIDFCQLIDEDRRAVAATCTVAAELSQGDLDAPTPCAEWTVSDLLAHMTGQQIGFAAAARGGGQDLALWAPSTGSYTEASAEVVAAFAGLSGPDAPLVLPEIRAGGAFPAALAVGFHLVDNVVHAWDLAVAIGAPLAIDDDVLESALRIAEQVPDGAVRQQPGAAFAPGHPTAPDAAALERTLLLLGRSPQWVSPRTASR